MDRRNLLLALAKTTGIIAPTLYSGITFAYNYILLPPLLAHAPPKLLAKQWLQAYQLGPAFVPPFILSGAVSNLLLWHFTLSLLHSKLYLFVHLGRLASCHTLCFTWNQGSMVLGNGKWRKCCMKTGLKRRRTVLRWKRMMDCFLMWESILEKRNGDGGPRGCKWRMLLRGGVRSMRWDG